MRSNPRQHFPALDGLRAVAVLLILLVHSMPKIFPWGWLGVQIFFVLSGFLITGILFDSRDRPTRYRDFYVRRALRIFPLYYLVLTVTVLLVLHESHPRHLWLWFAYLQNFVWFLPGMQSFTDMLTFHKVTFGAIGHFWSLAIEEQFYLFWPFVVFTVRSRQTLLRFCYAGIIVRLVVGVALQHWAPQGWLAAGLIYRMLPTQIDGFLMGAALALWMRGSSTEAERRVQLLARAAPLALALYAGLLFLLGYFPSARLGDVLRYESPFQARLGIPLANFVSLTILAAALVPTTVTFRFCNLAGLRKLGLISYGFYILHLYLLVLIRPFLQAALWTWPLVHIGFWDALAVFCTSTILAYASYRWIEAPFLRLKDRLAPGHRSTPSGREAGLVT